MIWGDYEDGHMRDDHSHKGEGSGDGGGTEDEAGSTIFTEVGASHARRQALCHLLSLLFSGFIFLFSLITSELVSASPLILCGFLRLFHG